MAAAHQLKRFDL
ncbi:hypothetical protein D030_4298A, partial [Vibrio parahaemolyticus AQ3810]